MYITGNVRFNLNLISTSHDLGVRPTIGSWDLRFITCFWYEDMMQSRLRRHKQLCYGLFKSQSEWVDVTHLLVMPPPGGSPGNSSAARNLITYSRSGSSSLDLIIWTISVKLHPTWLEITGLSVLQFIKEENVTFHFQINPLLQLCLLLQCLLRQLGGASEADDDDADVVQTTL